MVVVMRMTEDEKKINKSALSGDSFTQINLCCVFAHLPNRFDFQKVKSVLQSCVYLL